jgi:hypothetical protein
LKFWLKLGKNNEHLHEYVYVSLLAEVMLENPCLGNCNMRNPQPGNFRPFTKVKDQILTNAPELLRCACVS